jgi:hypothetical protein
MAYELADESRRAEAEALLRNVLVHDPKNVDLLVALGWVRQKKPNISWRDTDSRPPAPPSTPRE